MKKALLLLGIAAITTQPSFALFKIGPEVGLSFNKMTYSGSGTAGFAPTLSSVTGFRAGITTDIGISHIAVQPGIFYSAKGGTQSANFFGLAAVTLKNKVNYIEVPVWIQYKQKLGPGHAFVGLGPSVAMALNGKTVASGSALGIAADSTYNITFGSDSTDMKKLDYAANFNIGYQLSMGVFVRIFYSLGLANLSNDAAFDTKNRSFGISVGYLIGK
jgi:hypothetical protein